MLSLFSNKAPAKAKIVRWNQTPCLIARFSTSTPPMVWQLDLEKLTNYTINVVEKEGSWDLGYTTPQTSFTLIARFDERMDAEYAYDVIQKALLRGSPMSFGSSGSSSGSSWVIKLLIWLVILGVILMILSGISSGLHKATEGINEQMQQTFSGAETSIGTGERPIPAPQQEMQNGVPMSADDVLPKE